MTALHVFAPAADPSAGVSDEAKNTTVNRSHNRHAVHLEFRFGDGDTSLFDTGFRRLDFGLSLVLGFGFISQ